VESADEPQRKGLKPEPRTGLAAFKEWCETSPFALEDPSMVARAFCHSCYPLEAPSIVARPNNFLKHRLDPSIRILKDRPERGVQVTPTELLYRPFGQFLDHIYDPPRTLDGLQRRDMESAVNKFASMVCLCYLNENISRAEVIPALDAIFSCYTPQESESPSVPSRPIIQVHWTDGHVIGPAQTPEMIFEIDDEPGDGGADPEMPLVSYYTQMHKLNLKAGHHENLYHNSLLPALGISIVGKP